MTYLRSIQTAYRSSNLPISTIIISFTSLIMLVIGLTGGIASGKSTVSKDFRNLGLPVVDADVIAREVVEPGKKAYKQVVEAFQNDVPDLLHEDKTLNRPALGRAVFGKKDKLAILNKIVHGAVKKEIARQLLTLYAKGHGLVVLDVPLLYESGLHYICGATVTVSCLKDLQLKRLLERNPELSEDDCRKRIDSQLSSEERNIRADIVIENIGTLEELHSRVTLVTKECIPSKFWVVADLFPPFGAANAVLTIAYRAFQDYRRVSQFKKSK